MTDIETLVKAIVQGDIEACAPLMDVLEERRDWRYEKLYELVQDLIKDAESPNLASYRMTRFFADVRSLFWPEMGGGRLAVFRDLANRLRSSTAKPAHTKATGVGITREDIEKIYENLRTFYAPGSEIIPLGATMSPPLHQPMSQEQMDRLYRSQIFSDPNPPIITPTLFIKNPASE